MDMKPESALSTLELETNDSPQFAVIWMHGLGADGSDFVSVVPELGLNPVVGIRFVFPNAPAIPVTCNGGYVMTHTVCLEEIQDIGTWMNTCIIAD